MTAPIDVAGIPPTDRLDILRGFMATTRVPLEIHPFDLAKLRAHSRITNFGELGVQSTRGSSAFIVRTPKLAKDNADPSLVIGVVGEGFSRIRHNERTTVLRQGDITAYWSVDPYSLSFEDETVRHSFTISLERLGLPAALVRSQLGKRVAEDTPLQAIVSSHLLTPAANAHRLDEAERRALEHPTLELIRALLASDADTNLAKGPLAETLELRILAYLESHFADATLSIGRVAHAHGISERYVQLLLSRYGTSFAEWLRTRRLDAAAQTLEDPSQRFVTIAAIAVRWGFADHSHFSRAFRAEYGVTPKEWRFRGLAAASPSEV